MDVQVVSSRAGEIVSLHGPRRAGKILWPGGQADATGVLEVTQRIRSLRIAVSTLPSQGGNTGSNPVGSTKQDNI